MTSSQHRQQASKNNVDMKSSYVQQQSLANLRLTSQYTSKYNAVKKTVLPMKLHHKPLLLCMSVASLHMSVAMLVVDNHLILAGYFV